jgi:signal transduction histidine kinase
MSRAHAMVLAALVAVPLLLLVFLGWQITRGAERERRDRLEELGGAQLDAVAEVMGRELAGIEGALREVLEELAEVPEEQWTRRQLMGRCPQLGSVLLVSPDGRVVRILGDFGQSQAVPSPGLVVPEHVAVLLRDGSGILPTAASGEGDSGWGSWFYGEGIRHLLWVRRGDGHAVVGELRRAALIGALLGVLPDTSVAARVGLAGGGQRLIDVRGEPIYQWGDERAFDGGSTIARRAAPAPLAMWTLEYQVREGGGAVAGLAGAGGWMLWPGLFLLAAVLVALGFYLYREQARAMREARRRVSFVNHVSHELKTPLTNIRLYAELMESEIGEDEEAEGRGGLGRKVGVIVEESHRLSRLIDNVLTFAGGERQELGLSAGPMVVDEVVERAVEHAQLALEGRGMRVELGLGAREEMLGDADALEQILANLLGNALAHAEGASWLRVESGQDRAGAWVRVADDGAGVPPEFAVRIFEPFVRQGRRVTDPSRGAGLGLAISRQLARLHGGDLVIEEGGGGASFLVRLAALGGLGVEGGRGERR